LWCSSTTLAASAKPWSGVRRQRHCAALRTAERMAARTQCALQPLTRVDCPSIASEVSGASFDAGRAIEDRKGSGAKRRTPCTSAGAYPAAALLDQLSARRSHAHERPGRTQQIQQRRRRRPGAAATAHRRNARTARRANQAHLRPRRQSTAQPQHDGSRRVPGIRAARPVDEHGAGADGVARRARGGRIQGGHASNTRSGAASRSWRRIRAATRTTAG
jgi:hypothetical protein